MEDDGECLLAETVTDRNCKVMVEISLGDVDCRSILDKALTKLDIKLSSALYSSILCEVETIPKEMDKVAMMRNYVRIMGEKFATPETTESVAKTVLKIVIPEVINECVSFRKNCETDEGRAGRQTEVIHYLAGSVLKWGIKRFKKEHNEWCRSQIDQSVHLHDVYEYRDRGGLLRASYAFKNLMVKADEITCKYASSAKIDTQRILSEIQPSRYFPNADYALLCMLVRRYVRTRLHIYCKRKSQDSLGCIKRRHSDSLRSYLKKNN